MARAGRGRYWQAVPPSRPRTGRGGPGVQDGRSSGEAAALRLDSTSISTGFVFALRIGILPSSAL